MIFARKTELLQYVLRLVPAGYTFHATGEVEPAEVEAFMYRLTDRYRTYLNENQRRYRRKFGQANSKLLIFRSAKGPLPWILLATDGKGTVHELEKLHKVSDRRNRLTFGGYELARLPRKGSKARWTWRMPRNTENELLDSMRNAIARGNDDMVRAMLESLSRSPGFHGVRKQVYMIQGQGMSHWKRTRKGNWPFEKIYIGWVGRFRKPGLLDLAAIDALGRRGNGSRKSGRRS